MCIESMEFAITINEERNAQLKDDLKSAKEVLAKLEAGEMPRKYPVWFGVEDR
jgi:hypothetical protein